MLLPMQDLQNIAKATAGKAAAALVTTGMRVGLGSGSTFMMALECLAQRIKEEGLEIIGVPTSEGTAARARELGVPLGSLEDIPSLDLAIDGADEVDPNKHMIKGGGAALVREKIVAAAAREMVVVVDESKMVPVLGRSFRLPVEVMPFGWRQAQSRLEQLGCKVELRMANAEVALRTDNGNFILDCQFSGIDDPVGMESQINLIPAVVDNGLFVGMAGRIFIGNKDGSVSKLP